MPIDFQNIPVTIRVPGVYVEIDPRLAFGGLFRLRERLIVIGQKLSTGTAPVDAPARVLTADDAAELFGRGSMLHEMFVALKAANRFTETWALPVADDLAAVAAAGSVTIGGAATAAGVINLYIAGQRVRLRVAVNEANSVTASNLVAAINAAVDLPVTAAVDGVVNTQVNLTARNGGEAGNDIDVRLNYFAGEELPNGLTVTISAMTGGAANPDITAALAALGDEKYEHIVMPYTDAANLNTLETLLDERWGPLKMIEAFAYSAIAGTLSELSTFGNTRNSQLVSVIGAQNSPAPPYVWAAVYGATIAFHGNQDPARPFQTLELVGVLASNDPADLFTLEERDILLNDGIATFTVDDGNGAVRIERAITTYQTNQQGIPDPSFLDVNTVLTLSFVRRDLRFFIFRTFDRFKLADDGTPVAPGQAIATPGIIRDHIIGRFLQWQDAGLAENVEQFKQDLVVERNADDPNRVDVLVPVNIINQLRIVAVLQEFRL